MSRFNRRILSRSLLLPLGMTVATTLYLKGAVGLHYGSVSLPGEGFLPVIVGSLLVLGSLLLSLEALIKMRTIPRPPAGIGKREMGDLLLLVGTLFGFILVLPVLGFSLTTFGLVIGSGRIMRATWKGALILAFGITAVTYFVFIRWLQIPFPMRFGL